MEAILALLVFSVMAVSLTQTLASIQRTSRAVQDNMLIARLLDSKLTEVLTLTRLEEGDVIEDNDEIQGQIRTVVEPLELENEEGVVLTNMFKVTITALWRQDGQDQEYQVEGWRNSQLYRQ